MKVSILGAGPAGLYLAILLKRLGPAHEVSVVERNSADATFGWGVVFSEETLGALRDADPTTFAEITETFARWGTVDIRYRGHVLRSRGHRFSAISRALLLNILQRRCSSLGVALHFGTEITDLDGFGDDSDLVVGADGVNSLARRSFAVDFAAQVAPEGCRFAWFGTDLVLDAFTFIFKESAHGLFQVHAYPFDERTSTFIVECPEPVWRQAGLDEMGESASIDFCEELFADELDGHRLLSNRSIWTQFLTVRNSTWRRRNLVLIGDAAHTAHFTIGSGTKLAMEDAIALAQAFSRRGDVQAALLDYELERQPVVERLQEAASVSASFFERVSRSSHLEPTRFAFNLLTRSGRISHAGLAIRDPDFVRIVDVRVGAADTATPSIAPPPMFAPLRLGGVTLPNRLVGRAHSPQPSSLVELAGSGPGLLLTDFVAVSAEGRISPDTLVLDDSVAALAAAAGAVHGRGVLAALHLGHAGRRGATRARCEGVDIPMGEGSWPLLAASALPFGRWSRMPEAMTAADMARVRDQFSVATAQAAAAGFDAIELEMAHGYLLAGFLSPLSNRREDDFGGSPERRLAYPLEVLDAVRQAWPKDRLLIVQLTVTDWASGGLTIDDGIVVARELARHGAELVHIAAGQTIPGGAPVYRPGFLTELSERVRNEARVPTLVGGWLTTSDMVNTIVAAGRADLCILELAETELERRLATASVPVTG